MQLKEKKIEEAMEFFLNDTLAKNRAASTASAYKTDLLQFAKYLRKLRIAYAHQVKTIHISEYRQFLMRERGLKSATIERKVFCIKAFFKTLALNGIILEDPSRHIEQKKAKPTDGPITLSYQDIEMLIETARIHGNRNALRDVALLSVYVYTGCRRSEAISLDCRHINFLQRTIRISRGKNNTYDYLHMSDKLCQALMDYWKDRKPKNQFEPLFTTENGRLSVKQVNRIVEKYAEIAFELNVKITPRTFRNSFCVHLASCGIDRTEIRKYTGHLDANSVDVYTRGIQNNSHRVVDVFNQNIYTNWAPYYNLDA